jgi:Mn2+/Fe2+ NRAMP family transporter
MPATGKSTTDPIMQAHKNKTFATFLALVTGSIGLQRFYLHGRRDTWAWLHLVCLPLSLLLYGFGEGMTRLLSLTPLIMSALAGFIEAFVIGLTADEKWDRRHNQRSEKRSDSSWLLALTLVLTLAVGMTTLVGVIARGIDLYLTGGAYG